MDEAHTAFRQHDAYKLYKILNKNCPKQRLKRIRRKSSTRQFLSPVEETAEYCRYTEAWSGPAMDIPTLQAPVASAAHQLPPATRSRAQKRPASTSAPPQPPIPKFSSSSATTSARPAGPLPTATGTCSYDRVLHLSSRCWNCSSPFPREFSPIGAAISPRPDVGSMSHPYQRPPKSKGRKTPSAPPVQISLLVNTKVVKAVKVAKVAKEAKVANPKKVSPFF